MYWSLESTVVDSLGSVGSQQKWRGQQGSLAGRVALTWPPPPDFYTPATYHMQHESFHSAHHRQLREPCHSCQRESLKDDQRPWADLDRPCVYGVLLQGGFGGVVVVVLFCFMSRMHLAGRYWNQTKIDTYNCVYKLKHKIYLYASWPLKINFPCLKAFIFCSICHKI